MSKQDKAIALLQKAFDALESTTDSDIDDFESEEEEAEFAPVQYACRKIIEAMDILKSNGQGKPAAEGGSA
ncbi:hypothetical protein [uncultured Acidovorax sp.]|uniref:hypothetical protein n=1 Tax=uncultured Acidovorax sp. TaxID=158751 RepID=UPI0025863E0F|nr:hypothetical protein [uncultured Acidovorax sp.]